MKWLEEILLFIVVRVIWFVGSLFWISAGAVYLFSGGSRYHRPRALDEDGTTTATVLFYPEFWYAVFALCAMIALFGPTLRAHHRNRGRGKLKEIRAMSIVQPWLNVGDGSWEGVAGKIETARPGDRAAKDETLLPHATRGRHQRRCRGGRC